MRKNHTNIPVGVLDTDSDLTQVSPEDFTYSLNTRQHPGENIRRNTKGNVLVPYTNPAGVNETVGFVEDKYKKTGIEFVANSLGNHQIRRFVQDDDAYDLLLEWSGLNFSGKNIEAGVIDGRHLFWAEANGDFDLTGNQPRYLDMEYASLRNKRLCYEIYWDSASFANLNEYSISIEELDGTVVLAPTVFRTSTGGAVDAEALALFSSLVAGAFDITVTWCGNKIMVCAGTAEQRIYITSTGTDIHFVGTNHYPETIIEPYISLIRMMPRLAPFPRYVNDPAILENKVFGFTFQFRYRYLFWNGSKSKWSPISYVPTNFISDGGSPPIYDNSVLYNKIEIDFVDDIMASAAWKSFVRKIEVAVRNEFTGVWKSVEVRDIADFGVASSVGYEFLNDGTYAPVPSDENSEGDVQALGNFDFVPRLSRGLEVIQDERGRHRLSLAGNVEQYDQVDCANGSIEVRSGFPSAPPTTPTSQSSVQKTFKSGGIYDFYVIYEDDYGRQWPALKFARYNPVNPDWLSAANFPRITLNHLPPIEATRFRLAVSENQNQSAYIQLPAFTVNYWTKDPHPTGGDGTFTSTTYGAGDADFVGFTFYIRDLDIESQTNFIFTEDNKSLLVQAGDRLHIMGTDEDYLIEGYTLTDPAGVSTDDRYTVFIKFDASQPDYSIIASPTTYHLVELYRPLSAGSDIVYEIGNAVAITNAGLPTRSHGPAIDLENRGDTYTYSYKTKNYDSGGTPDVVITDVERPTLYAFKNESGQDFGRPNAEDPDYREVDSYDQVRVSDVYLPETEVNGFSSFRGTEYIRTRRDYGALQSLQFCNGVLLAIGQFASQPIYVGKEQLLDLSGSTSVGRSSQLLNIAGELDKMLGTHDASSIVNTGKYVYGWDGYRGIPWRYSVGGGQDPINVKNIELFRTLGKAYFPQRDSVKVLGGYQEEFDTYFLTFRESVRTGRTLGFSESKKGWEGDFSFIPSHYGSIGLDFFSFYDGRAYRHEDIVPCRFFGVDYNAEMKLVVNSDPQAIKLFWNIREQGSKWWVPLATIPAGVYPTVQSTRILAAKFSKIEGQYKVDIPRDGNDPGFGSYVERILRGRRMRGETLEITFRLELPSVDGFLKRVDTEYSFSNETK